MKSHKHKYYSVELRCYLGECVKCKKCINSFVVDKNLVDKKIVDQSFNANII